MMRLGWCLVSDFFLVKFNRVTTYYRGEYVVQAAQQISFAKAAELRLSYEEAFGHYKTAINTLLHGVQGVIDMILFMTNVVIASGV